MTFRQFGTLDYQNPRHSGDILDILLAKRNLESPSLVSRDQHWAPTPTPTPISAHAHGFWVGMGAILVGMGGHG